MEVTLEGKTMKMPKQEYTAEFKGLAVKRVKEGLTPGAAAKELGLNEQTLRPAAQIGHACPSHLLLISSLLE